MFRQALLTLFCSGFMSLHLLAQIPSNCNFNDVPIVLIAGDSWAQFMGDDGVYDQVFNAYGFSEYYFVTETLGSAPDPPYTGSAYAVSGSEARQWVDTDNYAYISNMVQALQDNPEINTVILSIGGNDILAGRSGGGWYKDMDLDNPGSEQALFNTIEANTLTIVNAALAVRPGLRVILSSYEYPNFDVELGTCWFYACPKREDLSRDPVNDLITNEELNQMMITVEEQRQSTVSSTPNLEYDNSIGLMHHIYGDGVSGPGVLPAPQGSPPYEPGGNPVLPTLRENFRVWGDPIHLDAAGYAYKVRNQTDNFFFEDFRGTPQATYYSEGGGNDGWVDVIAGNMGTQGIRMGDDGGIFSGPTNDWRGILSFNTADLPNNASVTAAVLYLTRSSAGGGSNPYSLGDRNPRLDIISGTFGGPAVEQSDGTATASATDVGCFHGNVVDDYDITRIDIHPSYLQHINNQGRTQFRLYFDVADWSDNYVHYFDGSEDGLTASGDEKSGKERGAIIYQQKTILVEGEDGEAIESTVEIPALQALGVVDLVGTTAPFLDLTYQLILPVELLMFEAEKEDRGALITWQSTNEEQFEGYELQRSADAIKWEVLAQVPGHGGHTAINDYEHLDKNPQWGDNFYRLKMNDLDGTFEYSDIRRLAFEAPEADWWVYPNPFIDDIVLHHSQAPSEGHQYILTDMLGRVVQTWTPAEGQLRQSLPVDPNLPPGAYVLRLHADSELSSVRVIKAR